MQIAVVISKIKESSSDDLTYYLATFDSLSENPNDFV